MKLSSLNKTQISEIHQSPFMEAKTNKPNNKSYFCKPSTRLFKASADKVKKLTPVILFVLLLPTITVAQIDGSDPVPDPSCPTEGIFNPLCGAGETGVNNVPELIDFIMAILVGFVGFIATIAIVVSGYQMILGGGDPEKIKSAKNRMLWAIMGIVVTVLAYSIAQIVIKTLTSGS